MNIGDLTITSLDTITAFDVVSGAYKFTLDELQDATISQTEDKTDITGKGGRKLTSLKRNKAVTISGNNGLISGGLLESQTGCNFATKNTEVQWVDYLTVTKSATTVATTYTPYGTVGAEIEGLYVKNSDGTLGEAYEQATTAAASKFSYTNKTITFNAALSTTEDKEIVVYYKRQINADVLENQSDSYSGKATLYIDAIAEDKCANIYHIQFYIPKADFSGEFSFEMGNDQSVHAFEAEALSGACGAGGTLWTYTIFQDTDADVVEDDD